jgi:kynurenine 3-monooxygenase
MLIALPNKDKSFTCTLFAPTQEFAKLAEPDVQNGGTKSTAKRFVAWFKQNFSDALELIGEDALVDDWEKNPRSALVSVKVRISLRYG